MVVGARQMCCQDRLNTSTRKRVDSGEDVTTVLLVDNHGRPSYGRFLNVKPAVGLITSTARTFVQEGVTTEYATQVVGTTLDDGRLYAHLLTKTSRVISDGHGGPHEMNTKLEVKKNQFSNKYFVKNTDFISPNQVDTHLVFPTTDPTNYQISDKVIADISHRAQEIIEDELLKGSPSNNIRVSSEQERKHQLVYPQNNIRVFKIHSNARDERENVILHKEEENSSKFQPSKVKEWDNIPTFTIRNEFSPSGFSYLGDLPDFEDRNEKKKFSTSYDRRAKNLFLAGLLKPSPKELKTTTYTGFADFTTTVGDTVIIFTPHTSEIIQKPVTKITVEPTIKPTVSFILPPPEMKTEVPTLEVKSETTTTEKLTPTEETFEEESKQYLQSKVIDKSNRQKYGKNQKIEQIQDMEAKAAVLAHEQQGDILTSSTQSIPMLNSNVIESSETQTRLLSIPSHEDIAKIFASLQAQASKATEPLNTPSTIFFDTESAFQTRDETKSSGGATTIFFEDDLPIENTPTQLPSSAATIEVDITTNFVTEGNFESTTESQRESTFNNISTSEKNLQSIDEEEITTEHESEDTTSLNEQTTTDDIFEELTTNEAKIEDSIEESCIEGIQVTPTTIYQTLTYLTTFFIPVDETTTTSIKAEEVITSHIEQETKSCSTNQISSTNLINNNIEATVLTASSKYMTTISEVTEQTTTEEILTTEQQTTTEQDHLTTTAALETTPQEITTERKHVTESEPTTTEETTEDGEEIELIFKTLYTTYTYLTTYFQDTTSSIASRIVVTTNVITSTLDPGSQSSEDAVAGIFDEDSDLVSSYKSRPASFEDFAEISPSQLDSKSSSSDTEDPEYLDSDFTETPFLSEEDVSTTAFAIKTYYTTYTYFTTIFVDGETEVSSRTEVYTNYVTPSIKPTGTYDDIAKMTTKYGENDEDDFYEVDEKENEDEIEQKELNKKLQFQINPSNKYNKTISRYQATSSYNTSENSEEESQDITTTSKDGYVTLRRTTTDDVPIEDNLLNLNDYESVSTMVKSSTSDGERRLLNNVDKRNILDDQIVSESNNDSEIIPSPTLLLQTSYTTFTYFTTMYQGTTASNVVSRLETVTNIVTETLTPSHTLSVEDLSLPITYFTTFTYWTTLYKQGTTKVTSREETISNVITPTAVSANSKTSSIEITATTSSPPPSSIIATSLQPSAVDDDYLTTVYTTYTYYTTSYIDDETVINSRLETVTSILNKTDDIELNQITSTLASTESVTEDDSIENKTSIGLYNLPTGFLSTIVNTVENSGITTVLSTEVIGTYINGTYAQILETSSSILTKNITPNVVENLKPTGIVSLNQGQIVDADEISTLYYTTQAVGTYINNVYAQVIQSTSSLKVDEEKRSSLAIETPIVKRTGLVRLIQGSIIQNKTTTLYQSKVIGTLIDGRYAQIIESTSSFLLDKSSISTLSGDISPTSTIAPNYEIKPTGVSISPSSAVIEGSIAESAKEEDVTKEIESISTKPKPSFQSKKKTFKPGIRPFGQRPKSSYSPKRRLPGATSATTVTRNDFTPTVTAIPASKARFGNRRNPASIQPTSSGSRRFSRPKSSNSFGGKRGSSRIQPTSTGFGASSRRGFRSSSTGSFPKSSGLFSNSARFRIRPSLSSTYIRPSTSATVTEPTEEEDDNSLTTQVTDEPDESENETTLQTSTTTEASRRQNPLLRFRRPPLGRPPIGVGRSTTPRSRSNSSNRTNNKVGTTTSKPKTTRASILSRNRANGLFPRRNLFTTSTTPAPPEEEEEEESDPEDETLIEESEEEEEDTDYEGSQKQTQTAKPPPSTRTGVVKIKPFNFRRRIRRDTYSRFRRPTLKTTAAPIVKDYLDYVVPKPNPKPKHNRFSPRTRTPKVFHSSTQATPTTPRKRIIPNKVKPQSRTQFTLRPEKEKSNFRRPSSSRPRTTTPKSRSRSSYNNHQTETTNYRKSSGRSNSRNSGNRRISSRLKVQSPDINDNYIAPAFDGTITITHQIPTEVTIPVINGKITEYKNIVTAKMSTEILDPAQYTTSVNPLGKEVTVLISELTTTANNGATMITQFILNETPTTTVIFTPTYIRNRKTSYSHVIPSTIYAVEQVVNTIQPALAAQAPLANILLSQLLLGGLQSQNPLLALQNPGVVPTPTTEYKTRTTTYVTTVTSSTSTVIPLTFRGKEILTTIVDSSVNVITATEFLTDTIVVTPTVGFPVGGPQLNTLLLPLLQQQLAQSSSPQLTPNLSLRNPEVPDNFQAPQLDEPETFNLALDDIDKSVSTQTKPRSSKGNKKPKKPTRVEPTKETSILTLYVSGKTPGEFSTVLSTIISDAKERKRRDSGEEIKPSSLVDDLVISTLDYLDTYVLPGRKELLNHSEVNSETESLESILGDVNKYIKSTTKNNLLMNPTKMNEFTKKFKSEIKASSKQNKLNNFLV